MSVQLDNALTVYRFWRPRLRLEIHAWAWVGNIAGETSMLTHPIGDHDQAFALLQWHLPRILDMKKATGIDVRVATVPDQLIAAAWEVSPKGPYKHVLPALDATETLQAAIDVLVRQLERSANPDSDIPKRVVDALYWQKALEPALSSEGSSV